MTDHIPCITRRQALSAALAAPLVLKTVDYAHAAAPMLGTSAPSHYRFKLGNFEVTTVNDGAIQLDGPHPIFGQNVEATELQALAEANMLPRERFEIGFSPVMVNTGEALVMFDSGNGAARRPNAGRLAAAMSGIGYSPDQVDIVVLTHFHPDHIGV
jgi:glyoxylase-like metal-dependent hydrolase (beta-lactamase superfamily II)